MITKVTLDEVMNYRFSVEEEEEISNKTDQLAKLITVIAYEVLYYICAIVEFNRDKFTYDGNPKIVWLNNEYTSYFHVTTARVFFFNSNEIYLTFGKNSNFFLGEGSYSVVKKCVDYHKLSFMAFSHSKLLVTND